MSCLFASLTLLPAQNVVFSFHENSRILSSLPYLESTPASIKKTEKENMFVYTFQAVSEPGKEMLDKSLDKFRKLEGFISLSVNAQNEVEVVTSRSIAGKDSNFVLLVSARLYGHIGYQILD